MHPSSINALETATVAVSFALLPLAFALAWVLAARRVRSGIEPRPAWRDALAEVGAVAGTLPWLLLVLTPRDGVGGLQLVPFADLAELAAADPRTIVEQLVGNLLLFAAAGFFAPIRLRIGLGTVALAAALGSAAVETAQFAFGTGRVASVDDALLNTLGAVLAALASRRWWQVSRAPNAVEAPARPTVLPSAGRDWRGRRQPRSPVARTGQLVVEGRLRRRSQVEHHRGAALLNL